MELRSSATDGSGQGLLFGQRFFLALFGNLLTLFAQVSGWLYWLRWLRWLRWL
jgi:hypothetical protein